MNELIQPSAPEWASILLLTLICMFGLSMIIYFVAFVMRSEKLGEFSIKLGIISGPSFIGLMMIIVCIVGSVMSNPNTYTITKTDDTIRVNSKSDWVANSTYNILEHKNGYYYIEDPTHPKNLIKISDDVLNKMMTQK